MTHFENPPHVTPRPIGALLQEFEHAVTARPDGELSWPDVDIETLHLLFQLLLGREIRRGDQALIAPGRILRHAQDGARSGQVSWRTPLALRRRLGRLADRLRTAELWSEASLWWEPLPEPEEGEILWDALETAAGRVPSMDGVHWPRSQDLIAQFTDQNAAGWAALPDFLHTSWIREMHEELEQAFRMGALRVEREGVGASRQMTVRRSDEVLYTSGLEPEIRQASPRLTVLVQYLLHRVGHQLAPAHRGQDPLAAPQNAMLARYPAPSSGYAPHLDNPGGDAGRGTRKDNGRTLTLVVYLNPPDSRCHGGELDLWAQGARTSEPPDATLEPKGGSAALFNARTVPHGVRPLRPGPARWAITLWLNDRQPTGRTRTPPPEVEPVDCLPQIASPALPRNRVIFHEVGEDSAGHLLSLDAAAGDCPRVGLVCTVYRGERFLEPWLQHHFALGVQHVVLIFDHLDEPSEARMAVRLRDLYGPERLTLWAGDALARAGWPRLPESLREPDLLRYAALGSLSHAIASRQTLNASLALVAAAQGDLGGPIDWLLHLDVDEWFHLEGPGRGGGTLEEHFRAASASRIDRIRYFNHEVLPEETATPRFKIHPRLAAVRLGALGWHRLVEYLRMGQDADRPYFNGYLNGKSAVRVEAARSAAGVHGWALKSPTGKSVRLAGPSILHFHFADPDAFRDKYLKIAESAPNGVTSDERPFAPSPSEEAAMRLVAAIHESGGDLNALGRQLEALHRQRNVFTPEDAEILEAADLLYTPKLAVCPQQASPSTVASQASQNRRTGPVL